ncbi:MAG TPA: GNAT family N-acetyltransferase [Candidatus Limnocylindria bacterium]|nr:GNAT family N-acetyltransferase [Candidatus Limnocylindria bacterium]
MGEIRVESWSRDSTTRPWNTIKDRIAELERECFGEDAFSANELRLAFNSRQSVVVLLWQGLPEDGRLIGYTQAQPADDPATYYIANTAIARSHQGRGLVKLLMDRLYADVRAAGGRFIERDAAIANGYADKIVRFHAADVLETFDHDSPYGPQRFIRMRVPDA